MCGIAGIFDSQSPPTRRDIGEMVRIQRHRGPDASGIVVDGAMALGMARLAIIDLQGGDQPMCSPDGSLAVVFNGEIYNYIELREDLISRGYQFRTRSDTEVLLHMYSEHGAGMLPHLNGMFAFAIWDAKLRTVLIARDRMGVKPLYYAQSGSRWFFASELKCLLTQSEVSTALDLDALADFLRLGYIPRQWTPYANVHKLLPGHYLMLYPDGHRIARWWDLAEKQQSASESSRERQRADLMEKFDDAVRLRMRSDVPVASFLSGGLDSSLVTVTAQRASEIPLNTFTLAFEHTEFDETPYARAVAEQANTWHRERIASPRHAIDHLPLLLWHMDEPMGDSSIIPNFLISK
ncbi:MAG: Asparagine synthetase, partial [Bryobacterales bacterium]|nr:Asparagine synthetase [Bryobacterales bacterium]